MAAPNSSSTNDDFITIREVAKRLGVARGTAYYLIEQRAIPYHNFTGKSRPVMRVKARDLEAFIASRRVSNS